MFCPICGAHDQSVNSYCRNCGNHLPDFEKLAEQRTTPQQHLVVNGVLGGLSAIVSASLAIALYWTFLDKDDTPFLIYLTAGFLTAIFFWQVQVIWRSVLLKRELPDRGQLGTQAAERFLPEADKSDFIDVRAVRETNRELKKEPVRNLPQSKKQPD